MVTPGRALGVSWRWARGRRLRLLGFRLATWLVALLGLPLCGVGVLVSWTVAEGAWVNAALAALEADEAERAQRNAATVASSASSIDTTSA